MEKELIKEKELLKKCTKYAEALLDIVNKLLENIEDETFFQMAQMFIEKTSVDFNESYMEYKTFMLENGKEKQWELEIVSIHEIIKQFVDIAKKCDLEISINIDEQIVTEEIEQLLNIKDSKDYMLDDNPILKAMASRGNEAANYGIKGNVKILNKKGGIDFYHAGVFGTAIKAYRSKKVTEAGFIVLTENQAIKTMLGTTGTPSEKQKADFRQAWEDMRNERMTYATTQSLAQIIGIEEKQMNDFVADVSQRKINIVEEYFVQGLKVIKKQNVGGKSTDIYLIKPCDIVKGCIDNFPWYENVEPTIQRVMMEDEEGNVKPWTYSKHRIGMQNYIYTWVYKCKRTRSMGQHISLKLPYETIFFECGLNVDSRQMKLSRIKDVGVILSHLKRCDEIADWYQYTDKTGKVRGVGIVLYKERLE